MSFSKGMTYQPAEVRLQEGTVCVTLELPSGYLTLVWI
jgi:hypothetical protein